MINIDGYAEYHFDLHRVLQNHLDIEHFYYVIRSEVSESLCEEETLIDQFFKDNGELNQNGFEFFRELHQCLTELVKDDIWPMVEQGIKDKTIQ